MGNYLELILPLYGVRFISINDAFDSDDYLGVTGGLELALRNLINNMYSRDLSTKVRSAFVPAICVVNTGEETASMATKSILITKEIDRR